MKLAVAFGSSTLRLAHPSLPSSSFFSPLLYCLHFGVCCLIPFPSKWVKQFNYSGAECGLLGCRFFLGSSAQGNCNKVFVSFYIQRLSPLWVWVSSSSGEWVSLCHRDFSGVTPTQSESGWEVSGSGNNISKTIKRETSWMESIVTMLSCKVDTSLGFDRHL